MEHAAYDDTLALQYVADGPRLVFRQLHLHAILYQTVYNATVLLVLKVTTHVDGYDAAYSFQFGQLLHGGRAQRFYCFEVAGEDARRRLTHHTDAQGKDYAVEGHLLGVLYGIDNLLG